jgi:hypothetical protein
MSTHDPISDLITRIRNAQMRAKPGYSRDRAGIEAGAACLCLGQEPAARQQRSRHFRVIDAEGNHG